MLWSIALTPGGRDLGRGAGDIIRFLLSIEADFDFGFNACGFDIMKQLYIATRNSGQNIHFRIYAQAGLSGGTGRVEGPRLS